MSNRQMKDDFERTNLISGVLGMIVLGLFILGPVVLG